MNVLVVLQFSAVSINNALRMPLGEVGQRGYTTIGDELQKLRWRLDEWYLELSAVSQLIFVEWLLEGAG